MVEVVNGPFVSDPDGAQIRKNALARYMSALVYSPDEGFVRMSGALCRGSALKRDGTSFHEAQGSTVGPHFELMESDRPVRVLIVPMEVGRPQQHVSVDARTIETLKAAQLTFKHRNAHMRGVTMALQLAFGNGLGPDPELEWLTIQDGQRVHVLEAYAMANLLLCSAVAEGTANSRSTSVMRSSCARHMRATVSLLEPTLVISQGATLSETLRATFGVEKQHSQNLAECELGGNRFIWADLYHPTRHWDSHGSRYLRDVVVPTLGAARQLALAKA